MIIFGRPEVAVSQSLIILPFASTDSPVAFQPHFRAHYLDAMFACVNYKELFVCLSHLFIRVLFEGQSFWI